MTIVRSGYKRRFRMIVWAWIVAGLAGWQAIAPAAEPTPAEARALRRTPAVEVFDAWKEAVVFVTGPMVKEEKPSAREFFVPAGPGPQESSVGSGFIVHESGYVVTNAHAAERLIAPVVVLSDGKQCPGELVWSFHEHDVALLKIDAGRPLKAVRLARSGDLLIGETVIVIANPHGLLHTCTTGVVSAIGRASRLADVPGVTLQNLIQSDAGINPGSSGGPWFNVVGEVIGFTTSMKRDAENIAFAVSAATLRKLLPEMLDVERRYGLATGLETAGDGPCQVTGVAPDSPAAKAGLQVGDVPVKLADRPIPTVADYHLAMIGRKPGETLSLEFLREGKPWGTSLVLGRRAKPNAAALLKKRLSLEATPLDPQRAKTMALRVPWGLVIEAVDGKLYDKLPVRPQKGDILARIGRIRPRSLEQAGLLLEKAKPNQPLPLVFLRHEGNKGIRIDMNLVVPP